MNYIKNMVRVKPLVDVKVIKETLTRIGIANKKEQILFLSCYLYQNFEDYYIVHFKEMFILTRSNGYNNISEEDLERKNSIIFCLKNWGLIDVDEDDIKNHDKFVYVLPFDQKSDWVISHKFNVNGVEITD